MGDIYFKSSEITDVRRIQHDIYISSVWSDSFAPDATRYLRDVVDTSTFRELGHGYYSDTNHIYFHFVRFDGGAIQIIDEADKPTFRALTYYYAVDSHHVYSRGEVLNGADAQTFTAPVVVRGDTAMAWIGRDKYHFFDGEDTISENEVLEGGIEFNDR